MPLILVRTLIMAATIALGSGAAFAEPWPSKPIRAFIPFAAGSATDIVPRALFEPLGVEARSNDRCREPRRRRWNSRHGRGGPRRTRRLHHPGELLGAHHRALDCAELSVRLDQGPGRRPDDRPERQHPDRVARQGLETVQDLVAAAKARPGSINYSSAGVGTATHIAAEKFRVAAGFEAVHIAYKGGAEALADVLGGRIDFYYCPISTALPFIEDGRVLALAASTSTRAPELPDVPTSLDAGYPNSDLNIWYGVFMPSRTPREIVEKFHAAATNVLATPATRQRLRQLAINPMPMTPAEMDRHVIAELSANEKLIKAAGIR